MPEEVQFQTETDETFMGKDGPSLVSDHETHSGVFTQEEVVTWSIRAPWGRVAVNCDSYGFLHLKTSRSFIELQETYF